MRESPLEHQSIRIQCELFAKSLDDALIALQAASVVWNDYLRFGAEWLNEDERKMIETAWTTARQCKRVLGPE